LQRGFPKADFGGHRSNSWSPDDRSADQKAFGFQSMALETAEHYLSKRPNIAILTSAEKAELRMPWHGFGGWKMFCSPIDISIDIKYLTFVRSSKLIERRRNDIFPHR
jgi:hypothetical protein